MDDPLCSADAAAASMMGRGAPRARDRRSLDVSAYVRHLLRVIPAGVVSAPAHAVVQGARRIGEERVR